MAESRRRRNVGFIELPDEALDVLNHYVRSPEWEVTVVVSLNPGSYAARLADVLQIPVIDAPNRLTLSSCDLLVVGDNPKSLFPAVREMLTGTQATMISSSDALAEVHREREAKTPESGILSAEMVRPTRIVRAEEAAVDPAPALGAASARSGNGSADRPTLDAGNLLGPDFRRKLDALSLSEGEDRLLREILSLAVQATHAQTGSIMLLDRDGEHLRIVAAEGLPLDVVANTRRKVGEGVSGRVFLQGEPVIVRGKVPNSAVSRHRPNLREAACIPIISDTRPIGVLNVNVETPDAVLDDEALSLLTRLAKEASGAILKAIDLRKVPGEARREALLRQVDRLLSLEESVATRLRAIGDVLRNATGTEFMHLFLVDPLGRQLELRTASRGMIPGMRQPLDRGVYGWAVRHGRLQVSEMTDPGSGSRIATYFLPVRTSRPHALIVLEDAGPDDPSPEEIRPLLQELLDQVNEVLSMEEGVDAQELLNQLSLRITDRRAELEALSGSQRTRAILEFTVDLLAAEAAIWVPDDGGRTIGTRPATVETGKILEAARRDQELLADWVKSKGAVAGGAVAPGWDAKAPRGPAPYVGMAHPDGGGVALLFFSAVEETGSPAQVPPHILFEVMLHVVRLLPSPKEGEDQGVFVAK